MVLCATVAAASCRDAVAPVPDFTAADWNTQVAVDSSSFALVNRINSVGDSASFVTIGYRVINRGVKEAFLAAQCLSGPAALARAPGDTAQSLLVSPLCVTQATSQAGSSDAMPRVRVPPGSAVSQTASFSTSPGWRGPFPAAKLTGSYRIIVDVRSSDGTRTGAGWNLLAPDDQRSSPIFLIRAP